MRIRERRVAAIAVMSILAGMIVCMTASAAEKKAAVRALPSEGVFVTRAVHFTTAGGAWAQTSGRLWM